MEGDFDEEPRNHSRRNSKVDADSCEVGLEDSNLWYIASQTQAIIKLNTACPIGLLIIYSFGNTSGLLRAR